MFFNENEEIGYNIYKLFRKGVIYAFSRNRLELREREVKALEKQAEALQGIWKHFLTREKPVTYFSVESTDESNELNESIIEGKIQELRDSGNYDGWQDYDLRAHVIQLMTK